MEKRIWTILLVLFVFVALSAKTKQKPINVKDFEREVWRLTNVERAKFGLSPYAYDEGLADLARLHSRNMIVQGFFAHKDHLNDEVAQRKTKYYPELVISSIGENLGKFMNKQQIFKPQELVDGWMGSPDHRKNMLDKDYTHLGIGLIFNGEYLWATQNFATPLVKLSAPIPKKIKHNKPITLKFEYLSPRPQNELGITLIYPDPNATYKISDKQEMRGAQPLQATWISDKRFEVVVPFNPGKGTYKLCFGWNGGYYPEGFTLVAK